MAFHGAIFVQLIVFMTLLTYAVCARIEAHEIHIQKNAYFLGTKVIEPADTPNEQPKEEIRFGQIQNYDNLAGNIYQVEKIVVDFSNRLDAITPRDIDVIQNAYKSIEGHTQLAIVGNVPISCMPSDDKQQIIDVSVTNYMGGIDGTDENFLFEYPNTQNFRSIWSDFQIINLVHVSNLRSLYVEGVPGNHGGEYTIQVGTSTLFIIRGPLQDVTLRPCSTELAKLVSVMTLKKADLLLHGHRVQWGARENIESNYFGINMTAQVSFSTLEEGMRQFEFGFMKLGVMTVDDDTINSISLNRLWFWLKMKERHVEKLVVGVRSPNQSALVKDLRAEGMPKLNQIRLIIFESDMLEGVFGDNFENDFKLVNEIKQFNPKVDIDYKIVKMDPNMSVDFSDLSEF